MGRTISAVRPLFCLCGGVGVDGCGGAGGISGFAEDLAHVQLGLLRFWRLHRRVHQPNVQEVNSDLLFGGAGVYLRFLAYYDSLNEQPQDFRRELGEVAVPFGLIHKPRHVGQRVRESFQPLLQSGEGRA